MFVVYGKSDSKPVELREVGYGHGGCSYFHANGHIYTRQQLSDVRDIDADGDEKLIVTRFGWYKGQESYIIDGPLGTVFP